jgi:hypothetical protein
MYRPPLRHVRPHMATGVDIGPRPRASGDIGLIAAASAPVRLGPISMAVASPYFSSSLRMTDLSEGRAPPRHYDPEGKASQPCRPNVEPGLKQALVLLDQLDGDPDTEPSLCGLTVDVGDDQEREGPDDNGVADSGGLAWVEGGTLPMPPERIRTRRVRTAAGLEPATLSFEG